MSHGIDLFAFFHGDLVLVLIVFDEYRPHSDGKYGLYIDKVFDHGSSAKSPAYGNEVLCGPSGSSREFARFDIIGLEVWATS